MLGAAPLVGGNHVPVAVDLADGLLEPEEAPRARVRLVAELHRGALLLGERGRAAVGQEIDVDVLGAQQERVEPRALQCIAARLGMDELDRLDDLDLPGRRDHGQSIRASVRGSIGTHADSPAANPKRSRGFPPISAQNARQDPDG